MQIWRGGKEREAPRLTGGRGFAARICVQRGRLHVLLRRRARNLSLPAILIRLAPGLPAGGANVPVRMVWQGFVFVVGIVGWSVGCRRCSEASRTEQRAD